MKSVRRRSSKDLPFLHIPFHILHCYLLGLEPNLTVEIVSRDCIAAWTCMQRSEPEIIPSTLETLHYLYQDLRTSFLSYWFPECWQRRVFRGNRQVRVKVRWARLVRRLLRRWFDFGEDLLHLRRLRYGRVAPIAAATVVPAYYP